MYNREKIKYHTVVQEQLKLNKEKIMKHDKLEEDPLYMDLVKRFDSLELKIDKIILALNPNKERYTYPDFIKEHYPTKLNKLEARIYKESQSVTGGEFANWFQNLTEKERSVYTKIYGH